MEIRLNPNVKAQMSNQIQNPNLGIKTLKHLFVIWILSFVIFLLPSTADAALLINRPLYIGLGSGLVGQWSFDGQDMAGNTAFDRSGQGNNGTLTNGPTRAIGRIGQALEFDGSNDRVDAGNPSVLNVVDTITISAWVYSRHTTASQAFIVNKRGGEGYALQIGTNVANDLRLDIAGGGVETDSGVLTRNTWHHVIATYDEIRGKIYVDGVVKKDQALIDALTSDPATFNIGNRQNGTTPFNGLIDEVRVYNRVLSQDEIKRLYKIGATAKIKSALAIDTVSSAQDSASSLSWSHTTSGTSRLLVVGVSVRNNTSQTVTSVTYAGRNLTNIGTAQNTTNGRMEMWYLINPPIGSNTVTVNLSAAAGVVGGAISFTGADQSSPVGTFASNTGTAATASVDVTSMSGEIVVDTLAHRHDGDQTALAGQTERWDLVPDAFNFKGAGSTEAGTRTVTMSWTVSQSGNEWALGAVPIKPARSNVNKPNYTGLNNGLVGYWSFDGPDMANVTAFDRSGQGNNGTLTNGPKRAIGRIGQALDFDGVNNYVIRDSSPFSSDNVPMTLCAWFKSRDTTNRQTLVAVVRGSEATTLFNNITASLELGGDVAGDPVMAVRENNGAVSANSVNGYKADTWYHACGVFVSKGDRSIYLDGNFEARNTASKTMGDPTRMLIGAVVQDVGSGRFTNGLIDEVRVYNRALSADEIKRLYNMGR